MARFNKVQVITAMQDTGLVPLFYHPDTEVVKQVIKACYDAGIRVFEFTNRGDYAHQVFNEVNHWAETECPEMILGVGTVIDEATAALYLQLGANFVVGTYFDEQICQVCNKRLVPYCPGCGTPTEINRAQAHGCDITKVFPADELGGPSFVANILAPFRWSNIMVSGGVTPEKDNLQRWIQAGAMCVGMGSQLFSEEIIRQRQWQRISDLCSNALKYIAQARLNNT